MKPRTREGLVYDANGDLYEYPDPEDLAAIFDADMVESRAIAYRMRALVGCPCEFCNPVLAP